MDGFGRYKDMCLRLRAGMFQQRPHIPGERSQLGLSKMDPCSGQTIAVHFVLLPQYCAGTYIKHGYVWDPKDLNTLPGH